MTKAVLFDFDETLQDRTAAFEKYMDTFMAEFLPDLSEEEKNKRKKDMVDGIRVLLICGNGKMHRPKPFLLSIMIISSVIIMLFLRDLCRF